MNILQDILGLITKGKVKTPTDKDYMVVASYTDAQEILKPQPKMQANLVNVGALKKYIGTSISVDTTLKATLYVDPSRSGETYTRTGNILTPFNTISSAYSAAVAAGYNNDNPAFIILLGNITENITFTQGGIWLTSFGSGTHGAYIITGSITFNGNSASVVDNHFSLSNLRISAPSNGKGIYSTGTNPQRLFLKDVWIDASGTTGSGIYADNSGTGSVLHLNDAHLTHSGTGDVYCVDVRTGAGYLTNIESSGSNVQVIRVGATAVVTVDSSELDGTGDATVEVYGGTIAITRSIITNTKTNGHGVALNTTGSIATIGDCVFNINAVGATTGKAIYGVATTALYYQFIAFYPASNTAKTASPTLLATPLATAFT